MLRETTVLILQAELIPLTSTKVLHSQGDLPTYEQPAGLRSKNIEKKYLLS